MENDKLWMEEFTKTFETYKGNLIKQSIAATFYDNRVKQPPIPCWNILNLYNKGIIERWK